ncbi:MAG TPA: hypothetical protein VES95_08935 [Dermatophilaceae bacterium]|nr:hypothetical protein [Dermatophilaceae bacterium]
MPAVEPDATAVCRGTVDGIPDWIGLVRFTGSAGDFVVVGTFDDEFAD